MGAHANSATTSVSSPRRACGLCSLQDWCWSADSEQDEIDQIQRIVRRSSLLPAGHHLFRNNDRFTAIYAVRNGCIKTYTTGVNGHQHVHGFHLPGELLGFDAVYPERHRFNAVTVKPSATCIVPFRDIAEISKQIPGLQTRILALMSREFSRQQQRSEGTDATQRTANFLFDVEARLRRNNYADYEFDLPMSREDIGNYLQFTPETMSRVISKLRRMGVIEVDRRHIRLLDVARLGLIAQGEHLA